MFLSSRIRRLYDSSPFEIAMSVRSLGTLLNRTLKPFLHAALPRAHPRKVLPLCKTLHNGKTYIACAIGNVTCRNGYSVKYFRVPELLLEIQEAKNENRYLKFMTSLQNIKLLILDDLGLKSYTLEESRDILEIAENRYNKASTILVGQIAHTKWYDLFPDPTIADAIMGRVIHNSYILALDSKKSMREVMAEKTMFPPAQNVNKLMVLPVQRMMDIMSISKL